MSEEIKKIDSYDISRLDFSSVLKPRYCDSEDISALERYYNKALSSANNLVVDDEFVGISYENLDYIFGLLLEPNNVPVLSKKISK